MAVAVAESNLACSPRPSTSFAGEMRLQSSSVFDLSLRGSWMMMPLIELSAFARMISSRSAASWMQRSITSMPISSPYCFLRLTYLVMTGLSESRKRRSLGLTLDPATWWAWRSLMKPASSLPLKDFIESPRVLVRASSRNGRRLCL